MYQFNQIVLETQTKQSEMLKAAEQQRLVRIAQGDQRRFRFLSWLPKFRLQPHTSQSKTGLQREVRRKPASNQA